MLTFNFTPFPIIATERLLLRQLILEDEKEIFLLRSDEGVNRYLDRPKAQTIQDARSFIQNITDGISNNDSIYWAIHLKEDPQLIGTICLWNLSAERAAAEIGYELLPAFQGKGIMQEALTKVIEFGFHTMQLQTLEAWVSKANGSSIRMLERNCFRRDFMLESKMPPEEKEKGMVIYALKRFEFLFEIKQSR
jgi:ribosomal-protein-alanine N-acetyltransferase